MSKKFALLALAASLLAFSPLAMAQSASDQGTPQQQSAEPAQNQGPGNPNAPGGCYNAPQPGQGC
jgi:hypothetical protein